MKMQRTSQLNIACAGTTVASKSPVNYLGDELDKHVSDECIAKKAVININNK